MNKNHHYSGTQFKTTVIVPFYNNRNTLRLCAESLLACNPPADELIFIDDGSIDGSADCLADLPIVLHQIQHSGRAAALNAGLKKAKGDLILFTDADCIVPNDWIDKYLTEFSSSEFDGIGGNLWPSRFSVVEISKVLRYIHEFQKNVLLADSYTLYCLNGNNMAIKKTSLDCIEGFDEGYHHGADADLTRKLLEKGCRLFRTTTITTNHLKVDALYSFLKTAFHRGSTIRFSSTDTKNISISFFNSILSSGKYLVFDLLAIPQLKVFEPSNSMLLKGGAAAFVNLLASFWNIAGRLYYAQRFKQEGKT